MNSGKKEFHVWLKPFFWSSPEFGEKVFTIFGEDFFFGLHLNSGKKIVPFFGEDVFFFGLHLICSPEQNRGRGSSPPMLKIGQN